MFSPRLPISAPRSRPRPSQSTDSSPAPSTAPRRSNTAPIRSSNPPAREPEDFGDVPPPSGASSLPSITSPAPPRSASIPTVSTLASYSPSSGPTPVTSFTYSSTPSPVQPPIEQKSLKDLLAGGARAGGRPMKPKEKPSPAKPAAPVKGRGLPPPELEAPPPPNPAGVIAPKVHVIDGKLVLDKSSLVVVASAPATAPGDFIEVEESGAHVTSSSYAHRTPSERWSVEDTEKFYDALRQYGTDFSILERIFTSRSRRQLKNKFKREEKEHGGRVDQALRSALPLTIASIPPDLRPPPEEPEAEKSQKEGEEEEEEEEEGEGGEEAGNATTRKGRGSKRKKSSAVRSSNESVEEGGRALRSSARLRDSAARRARTEDKE